MDDDVLLRFWTWVFFTTAAIISLYLALYLLR